MKKNHYLRYSVSGHWHGEIHIEVKEEAPEVKRIPLFETAENAIRYFTGSLIGFYGSQTTLYRFEVWHSPVKPHLGTLINIRLPLLINLGLLEEREVGHPLNLLMAPQGKFRVFLPVKSIDTQRLP